MTYWNMRAYSDEGEGSPKASGADTDTKTPARAPARRARRGGQAEIGNVGMSDHVTRNQRGRR